MKICFIRHGPGIHRQQYVLVHFQIYEEDDQPRISGVCNDLRRSINLCNIVPEVWSSVLFSLLKTTYCILNFWLQDFTVKKIFSDNLFLYTASKEKSERYMGYRSTTMSKHYRSENR